MLFLQGVFLRKAVLRDEKGLSGILASRGRSIPDSTYPPGQARGSLYRELTFTEFFLCLLGSVLQWNLQGAKNR